LTTTHKLILIIEHSIEDQAFETKKGLLRRVRPPKSDKILISYYLMFKKKQVKEEEEKCGPAARVPTEQAT